MTADTPSPSEVVEKLRREKLMIEKVDVEARQYQYWETDLGKQAADLIEDLSSPRSSTVDEATVEAVALRELLQPLVEKADRYDRAREVWGTDYHDGFTVGVSLGTCRKVRAAIASLPSVAVQPIGEGE